MADGGEIAFVLGVLEFYLFFSQPVPINRADQLLIFFEQSLPEFLSFLIVHCVNPLFCSETLMVPIAGHSEYMPEQRSVNHQCLTINLGKMLNAVSLTLRRATSLNISAALQIRQAPVISSRSSENTNCSNQSTKSASASYH